MTALQILAITCGPEALLAVAVALSTIALVRAFGERA